MKLQEAIKEVYGHRFGYIAPDGVFYKFKIDRFRIGFVVSIGDVGIFGCRADREAYAWNEKEVVKINLPAHEHAKIRFERLVIECARGLIQRGEILSPEDDARLELAVKRLSEI